MDKRLQEELFIHINNKTFFKATLKKVSSEISDDEHFELLVFCYREFSNIYPEVLIDVLYN